MLEGVAADANLVPDDWASRSPSNVINLERLSCVKRCGGVVEATTRTGLTRC